MDYIISIVISVVSTVSGVFVIETLNTLFLRKRHKNDQIEVDREVQNAVKDIKDEKDILEIMIRNVKELKEYYVINKQQARNSFSAALLISVLGFFLFSTGIIINTLFQRSNDIIIFTTISGSIIEIISGLFFWLYNKAIKQINIFHESLQDTQKYLTAIQLSDRMTEEKRDLVYSFIIGQMINKDISGNILKRDSE
jgi:hypothetical protein